MDVSNGGGYEEVTGLAEETWYSLWRVRTNTNPGAFELYLQSGTEPNYATQTKLSSAAGELLIIVSTVLLTSSTFTYATPLTMAAW